MEACNACALSVHDPATIERAIRKLCRQWSAEMWDVWNHHHNIRGDGHKFRDASIQDAYDALVKAAPVVPSS